MDSSYSSYEKVIENTVIRIKHYVRGKYNESASSIISSLRNVPNNAVLEVFDEEDNYFELLFVEEKIKD